MSLINQMLQDLDERKGAYGAGSPLPNDVRPLPRQPASRWPMVAGFVVALLIGGGLAAYWSSRNEELSLPALASHSTTNATAIPDAAQPPVAAAPAALVAPVQAPPLPAPETPPVEVVPPAPEPTLMEGSLRMDDLLDLPPPKANVAKTARAVPPLPGERAKPETLKPAATVDHPAPAPAEPTPDKSARQPVIEKTEAASSPRERVDTEYRKAIAAVNQGRMDEALAGLRSALRQDAFHQASRQLLVKLLLEAKRTEEAEQVLQEGLQGQPAQLGWAMTLARLQVDRGDLAGAWQTLNYSQPAASGNADYQGFSGHVLQRLGRHKDAIERYLAAARLSPNDGRWWLGLGLSLEADGRAGEAREAFQRARQCGNLGAELAALVDQKLK